MRHQNVLNGIALFTLMGTGAVSPEHSDKKCKKLEAQIIAVPLTTGCTSAFGLCTAGTIDGNQGLHGTTRFVADGITPSPATAPDGPATIAYSGVIHIVTQNGTLDVRDTGVFDTATGTPTGGLFVSFDRIDGGTGRFAGATGTLLIGGRTVEGRLVADVTGELCER
ncbi:MAG: hypothetical protein ABJF01_25265 [bacterium]